MSATLRTRLWWSYVLVIVAALCVVSMVLLLYLVQNPATYREASARLTVISALMKKNELDWTDLPPATLQAYLERVDSAYATRVLVYNARRQLIADSRSGQELGLNLPLFPRLRLASVLLDGNGTYWLYQVQQLADGRWVMVAVVRPSVPLVSLLTDELMLPICLGGLFALVISLLVAFWLSRTVGGPLQEIVVAAQQMPSEQEAPVSVSGPPEIQELSRAFNELNRRVLTTQRSQREFVANVSHELKTPLTSVQGFAQAILDGTAATPETRQQAAQVIFDEAGRMHRMVIDLLDLARLDAGTFEMQRGRVDLTALLKNVAEKFIPLARSAGVAIYVESGTLPDISGDGDRLAQVFTNLIDNALKFTPPGGRIALRAARLATGIQIEVADSGAGIPENALPHIFDRFYQVDPSRTGGRRHGAGLGLAIVKEIVAAHGGTLSVRSRLGAGTTFTVLLPLSSTAATTIVSRRKK